MLRRLGGRVRSLRLAAGYTQELLAERCGLHPTYVSSVERGERNVTTLNLVAIARALGVTASTLIDGVEA